KRESTHVQSMRQTNYNELKKKNINEFNFKAEEYTLHQPRGGSICSCLLLHSSTSLHDVLVASVQLGLYFVSNAKGDGRSIHASLS
ncbi:unnamed protein product, partial [Dovyalis caffra]